MNALCVSGYFNGTDAVGGYFLLNIIWSNCPWLYEEKGPDKEIGMKTHRYQASVTNLSVCC